MGTSITFPNGQVLVSNAYTPQSLLTVLQPIACGMLGVIPPNYSRVRLDWQQTGQPAFLITDDVCSIRVTEENLAYAKIRDLQYTQNDTSSLQATWTYQRTWRCFFTNYGPNAEDFARAITDAMFVSYFHDMLAQARLYLVPDFNRPVYLKELKDGQWWARCDLQICMNELVTTSVIEPSVASVNIILYDDQHGLDANISTPVSVMGSVGGAAVFSQTVTVSSKQVMILLQSLNGSASFVFPTVFVTTPTATGPTGTPLSVVTNLSTTTVTVTGTTTTGVITLSGN